MAVQSIPPPALSARVARGEQRERGGRENANAHSPKHVDLQTRSRARPAGCCTVPPSSIGRQRPAPYAPWRVGNSRLAADDRCCIRPRNGGGLPVLRKCGRCSSFPPHAPRSTIRVQAMRAMTWPSPLIIAFVAVLCGAAGYVETAGLSNAQCVRRTAMTAPVVKQPVVAIERGTATLRVTMAGIRCLFHAASRLAARPIARACARLACCVATFDAYGCCQRGGTIRSRASHDSSGWAICDVSRGQVPGTACRGARSRGRRGRTECAAAHC